MIKDRSLRYRLTCLSGRITCEYVELPRRSAHLPVLRMLPVFTRINKTGSNFAQARSQSIFTSPHKAKPARLSSSKQKAEHSIPAICSCAQMYVFNLQTLQNFRQKFFSLILDCSSVFCLLEHQAWLPSLSGQQTHLMSDYTIVIPSTASSGFPTSDMPINGCRRIHRSAARMTIATLVSDPPDERSFCLRPTRAVRSLVR